MTLDPARSVLYRNFYFNDPVVAAGSDSSNAITGCQVDYANFDDVDVVQFLEKRSLQDGMDAGDVYLGARRLRMQGTLYGATRALLFDGLADLRAAMSPTLAFREQPADKGYLPLYFSRPTNRISEYASGAIDLRVLALPRALQAPVQRDNQGGEDGDSLAIPWQAIFICKDPTIQAQTPQDFDLTAATSGSDLENRGNYHVPLNFLIVVGSAAGSIDVAIGDSTFTITIPSSTGNRTLRYDGAEKVLTVQEGAGQEINRMSWLTFTNSTTHPLILSGAGQNYAFTFTTVTPGTGSHFWFYEAYA